MSMYLMEVTGISVRVDLFNNLINDLEDGENSVLMKFVADMKLEALPKTN